MSGGVELNRASRGRRMGLGWTPQPLPIVKCQIPSAGEKGKLGSPFVAC